MILQSFLLLHAIQILIVFNEDPHRSQIFHVYGTLEKWGKATMSVHYSPDIVKAKIYCMQVQLST